MYQPLVSKHVADSVAKQNIRFYNMYINERDAQIIVNNLYFFR